MPQQMGARRAASRLISGKVKDVLSVPPVQHKNVMAEMAAGICRIFRGMCPVAKQQMTWRNWPMVACRMFGMFAAGVLVLGLGAAASAEEMNPIQARQACMKANGAAMGVMVPMIKGEKPYDGAAVQTALASTGSACAGWAKWWGDDTKPGGAIETWAKDEVWTDRVGFDAAGGKYAAAFGALKATTDEAGFKAAFGDFGGSCKGCHDTFRRPKE